MLTEYKIPFVVGPLYRAGNGLNYKKRLEEVTMKVKKILLIVGLWFGLALFIQGSVPPPAMAKVRLAREAVIHAEANTMHAIQTLFNQVEEAIHTGDLEALMKLYSQNYHFGALTKDDRRQSWKNLFTQYHHISSYHSFSRIVVISGPQATAEVMCTGTLWATTKGANRRINLVSWLGDLHYLIDEEGQWRIGGPGKNTASIAQHGWTPPPPF